MRIEDAYAECGLITRREARNFGLGIMTLPRAKREALTALYAFARRVDDIADSDAPSAERRAGIDACVASLDLLPRAVPGDPVLTALGDAMVRYPIPKSALLELLEGAAWDSERATYGSWPELREYCRHVAGAIGVACTAVYGPSDWLRARPLAEALGIALQQINIMRDVAEDLGLGRVYLPQDELQRYGVSSDDLAAGSCGDGWRGLMVLQASRARAHLIQGFGLLELLDRRSAICVRTLAGVYVGLLEELERTDFDVFTTRPRLSTRAKLGVAGRGIARELVRSANGRG